MTEHAWDDLIVTEALIGLPPTPHRLKIYAPDPLAVAITGQISAFSLDNGCGVKFILGVKYLQRARQSAEKIAQQADEL